MLHKEVEMSNSIQIFNYHDWQVRTVVKDGEPWFVARDVADALGISDTRTIVERLDSDEWDKTTVIDSIGRDQEVYAISESGLYEAINRSNKPGAKDFQRWVRKDVLPAIRKHGVYAVDELLNDPELAIKAFTALKEERERNKALKVQNITLETENKLLAQENLTWADRKIIEAVVKKYGAKFGYPEAWREFKKELLYKHGINLNSRITNYMNSSGKKTAPKTLNMIHDDELQACISTAIAICKHNKIDISDILSKFNKTA